MEVYLVHFIHNFFLSVPPTSFSPELGSVKEALPDLRDNPVRNHGSERNETGATLTSNRGRTSRTRMTGPGKDFTEKIEIRKKIGKFFDVWDTAGQSEPGLFR